MAIRAYYDGSGQKADSNHPFITLVGLAATEETWPGFIEEWESTLKQFDAPAKNGVRYYHFREIMQGEEGYRSDNFDRAKVFPLTFALANIISAMPKQNSATTSCTIHWPEYEAVKQDKKLLPFARICVDHCVGLIVRLYDNYPRIELIFDNNEPYLHVVKAIRQRKKRRAWWKDKVADPIPSDIFKSVPLQAADMIAGFVNRFCLKGGLNSGHIKDKWGMKLPFISVMVP